MTNKGDTPMGDKESVLIVTDQRGFIIQAGKPECLTKKQAFDYARAGFTMKTITIGQYRKKKWKWIYDAPNKNQKP